MNKNKHIFDYLDYYVDLPHPPRYAVMLTGPWGIGKSHNVKLYLEGLEKRGKKVAYVSLYGIKSADEIAIALLAALLPKQGHTLGRLGAQFARAFLKKLTYSGEVTTSIVGIAADRWCDLIVLDDLERAILRPDEVLGFINAFIEHEKHRVLIVANEEKLSEEYRAVREKVVGMTFELVEQSDQALAQFIPNTSDGETRQFLSGATDAILKIFSQSATHNLRVLDQSLRSWERVHKIVAPTLRKKTKGMLTAFKLFLAFSLEIRSGRLKRADLEDRLENIVAGTTGAYREQGGTPMSQAQGRYEDIYLHDSILSENALTQVLFDGLVDPEEINRSMSAHELFVEPDEEPNWRKVWHGFLRDAQEFEQAFEGLEREFAARTHDEPDVVLHVMGLRLWGAEIGQLPKNVDEIIAEGMAYVDDLRRTGRLPRFRTDQHHHGAYGLAFHNANSSAFPAIVEVLRLSIGECLSRHVD